MPPLACKRPRFLLKASSRQPPSRTSYTWQRSVVHIAITEYLFYFFFILSHSFSFLLAFAAVMCTQDLLAFIYSFPFFAAARRDKETWSSFYPGGEQRFGKVLMYHLVLSLVSKSNSRWDLYRNERLMTIFLSPTLGFPVCLIRWVGLLKASL